MKLTKKFAALAIVAALASSTATAFAAPASKYDSLMTKAQDLYDQGLYYEANYVLAQATKQIPVGTPQITVLQAAVDFQIGLLETLPPTVALPQAFGYVEMLMANGLYYEALDMLAQAEAQYALAIADSVEFQNKIAMLKVEIKQALADYEMDYVVNMLAQGLYYEANAEYATIPVAEMTTQQWERYTLLGIDVAYALDHVIMTAESAEAVLLNDTDFVERIQADPDMEIVTAPIYHGKELVGFEIAVYSKNAVARKNGAALATYFVDTDGSVMTFSAAVSSGLVYTYDDIVMPHDAWMEALN